MNIRSVTLFCDDPTDSGAWVDFLAAARTAFHVPVQTTRLALPPWPDWWPPAAPADRLTTLISGWRGAGIDYVSLGPVQLRHADAHLDRIPQLIEAGAIAFASAEISDRNGRIDIGRIQRVAHLVKTLSTLTPDGFGNLYFTALANCPPGSPFFPVAYHRGGAPRFALAVESADIALNAIRGATSLAHAQRQLTAAIERETAQLAAAANALARQYAIPFAGIDFSLAPFPTDDKSLGGTLEALGLSHVGTSGTLFAAAFVTSALQQARFPRCGFNGLMLPVLEDSVLARRAAAGTLAVGDLLSYSAVCGVGLDTVPLPGDCNAAQLAAILLDVAALAVRLNKPLTARLMPLPGLSAGDAVTFDFPYFANSRVMALTEGGIGRFLTRPDAIQLKTLHPTKLTR